MKIKFFLVIAVLVTAILCSAGVVGAQTVDNTALIAQLQAQIQALLQQIAILQGQQGGEQTWCYTFTRNLGFASTGTDDVWNLHKALNKEGFSSGSDDINTYGEDTAAEVVRFQAKYRILQSGYVGSITRAKLNALYGCTTNCVGEGGTARISPVASQTTQCCPGLVAQYPGGISDGSSWTCIKPPTNSYIKVINSDLNEVTALDIKSPYTLSWDSSKFAYGSSLTVTISNPTDSGFQTCSPGSIPNIGRFPFNMSQGPNIGTCNKEYVIRGGYQVTLSDGTTSIYSKPLSLTNSAAQCTVDSDCPQPNCLGATNCIGSTNRCIDGRCVISPTQPYLTIISPNGGETYKPGDTITVNWKTNNVPSSKILDVIRLRAYPNGQEYNLVINTPNDGQEVIPIPSSVPAGAYTLEIKTYLGDVLVFDASDSYFKIYPTLTCANNGEKVYGNSSFGPTQCCSKNAGTKPSATQSGDTCVAPTDGSIGTCVENWWQTCGNGVCENVTCTAIGCPSAEDKCNCPKDCDPTKPSITVISPNGGEAWQIGQTYTIKYSAKNISAWDGISIYLQKGYDEGSTKTGVNSSLLIGQTTNLESFSYTVPSTIVSWPGLGNNYTVKVCNTASCTTPNVSAGIASDESDSYFKIVSLTSQCNTDSDCPQIACFTTPCPTYKCVDGKCVDSNTILTIAGVVGMQSTYSPGEKISFSLKGVELGGTPASREEGFNVQAYICKNGDCNNYLPPNPSGSYNGNYNASTGLWDVSMYAPSDSTPAYSMKVALYCSQRDSYCWNKYGGYSSGNIQVEKLINFIVSRSTQPSISITSPNGGEVWQAGSKVKVTWKTQNIPDSAKIMLELFNEAGLNAWWWRDGVGDSVGDGTVIRNTGEYSLTVPSLSGLPGKFKLQIRAINNVSGSPYIDVNDYSDNYFTISSATNITCTETDNGIDYYTKGTTIGRPNIYVNETASLIDRCEDSFNLIEYACGYINNVLIAVPYAQKCPNGCRDGACIISTQTATDSDNSPDYLITSLYNITPERYPDLFIKGFGKGFYVGGGPCLYGTEPNPTWCKPTTDSYTTYYDHCASATQLNEAYVSKGKLSAHGLSCPNGCLDGACIASVTRPGGPLNVSLDGGTPASQNLNLGQANVYLARIQLNNSTANSINNLNGIQVASSSPNASSKLTSIRVYDEVTNTEVGNAVSGLTNNGSYYYAWINVSGFSIPANTTKTLKLVADVKPDSATGSINLGIAGLNFDQPGCTTTGMPVYGNNMTIVSNTVPALFMKVLSPNGGETLTIGQAYNVTWQTNITGTMGLDLVNYSNEVRYRITPNLSPSTGTYSWNVSNSSVTSNNAANIVPGTMYKIQAYNDGVVSTHDYSDNYFSIVAPTPVCTPSWQCTAWDTCTNSQQARNCTDSNGCGVTTNKPAVTQSCVSVCTPSWQCTAWGSCSNSANAQQTRNCTDSNNCGVTTGKPALTQSCTTNLTVVGNAQIYNDTNSKVPGLACTSGKCNGIFGSCSGQCDGGYYPDQATANKLCQMKGYDSASSFTIQSNFYSSCNDNFMWKWGTSTEYIPACTTNTGIDTVTCARTTGPLGFFNPQDQLASVSGAIQRIVDQIKLLLGQ